MKIMPCTTYTSTIIILLLITVQIHKVTVGSVIKCLVMGGASFNMARGRVDAYQ